MIASRNLLRISLAAAMLASGSQVFGSTAGNTYYCPNQIVAQASSGGSQSFYTGGGPLPSLSTHLIGLPFPDPMQTGTSKFTGAQVLNGVMTNGAPEIDCYYQNNISLSFQNAEPNAGYTLSTPAGSAWQKNTNGQLNLCSSSASACGIVLTPK